MQSRGFTYNIFPCGSNAITVDFGNVIDEAINKHVLQLFNAVGKKNIPGVTDIIPAYSSIAIVYDVIQIRNKLKCPSALDFIKAQVEGVLNTPLSGLTVDEAIIQIQVCYEEAFAPDIQEMAGAKKIGVNEIIALHTAQKYRVYMLGFLPGFAYMGIVDEKINMPRKPAPRVRVPEGSVGIAGGQTGIYSLASPGGWNIIGQTPLKLFDAAKQPPVLLQAGNYVQFYAIGIEEFNQIKAAQ